ncbi:sirohydrochlorin chelatase [Planctomicrobium sp. SH668]|uniref:sirohydrochlorin chelatase n=1 Tax=Planctomicrobium sp. SH668 TaxID=3448126 RepID=UPI003F5C2396
MSPTGSGATLLWFRDFHVEWSETEVAALCESLRRRLGDLVLSVHGDHHPLSMRIEEGQRQGRNRFVVLPVGVLPVPEFGEIRRTIEWARKQWPEISFEIAPALKWIDIAAWIRATVVDELKLSEHSAEATKVVLVGEGSESPLANTDVARLAFLALQESSFRDVQAAFLNAARPSLDELMSDAEECEEQQFIVPWEMTQNELESLDQLLSDSPARIVRMSLTHSVMVNLLVANRLTAIPSEDYFHSDNQSIRDESSSFLTDEEWYELQRLERRIESMLPSEYRGALDTVAPTSMGSAQLNSDEFGVVEWDKIWTSFCDLALAGGPPHRGKLLEAVPSYDALAQPERYAQVVEEIERGIRLVTQLPTFRSPVAGWIGIRCHSEEMAAWLMRAIIVENVMVRREGVNLFLPAGPEFAVKKEIKNVITSVAKTVHYWSSHLKSRNRVR